MNALDERGSLLAWQLRHYPGNHTDRINLAIHIGTVPLFWLGALALVLAPLWNGWLALPGIALASLAVALQGRGHRREPVAPIPFRGPFDIAAPICVEQLVTWPRFVLGGGLLKAWRAPRA